MARLFKFLSDLASPARLMAEETQHFGWRISGSVSIITSIMVTFTYGLHADVSTWLGLACLALTARNAADSIQMITVFLILANQRSHVKAS